MSNKVVIFEQKGHVAIFPGGGSTVRLPNQIPYARAMEVLLTGDQFSAESMLEFGFLNYVVPENEVLDKALEMAGKIAVEGPRAFMEKRKPVFKGR